MKRFVIALTITLLSLTSVAVAQEYRPFNIEELLKVRRVSDPQVSPDGRSVAFTIGDVNFEGNRVVTHIYVMPLGGGNMKQLTSGERSATTPRWSPDGKKIAYVTGSQIWVMDADGDDKEQVTKISTGASGPVWSPDRRWIAFTSDVYPECTNDECNKRKDEEAEKGKVKAIVTDRLLFRHWNEVRDKKRTHVFVAPAGGGEARDITPGDFDSPPYAVAGDVDYSFSPDSKELAYLRNPDKVEAISTNSDIFIVPLAGGTPRNITARNRGYDDTPTYTNDGRYILYRSQTTAGFEADRWRLMSYNRASGVSTELLRSFDLNVEEMVESPDGKEIYFAAGERGRAPIYTVPITGGVAQKTVDGVFASGLQITSDGRTFVFSNSSLAAPPEIYRANNDGSHQDGSRITPITRINDELIARTGLKQAEELEWNGALGAKVHGFLIKPVRFDARRKYPLVVLIHGGPQSAWNNSWSYRWNPQVFTDAGYVVFMPNPRGSLGYGQRFVNEISADWGGKAFVDLKNGIAEVLRKNPYVDKANIGGAGASYGGYMVDWILGHNNDPRFRFKSLVSHASVYNLTSMYGATEELWFPEWEFKGTPWTNPAMYERWSPHKFVANFNTPTLVTAGELDYRVPYTESLQLYTALQRKGVESKLILFPDEGHWILKPQNSKFWYDNVLGWLNKHLK
ncbi:MAG TPA: S9 family peptidase [Pyrinomonadaceae bacterium]|nr:S9 family peptidase [Pyrinomonadaceae bacterium]